MEKPPHPGHRLVHLPPLLRFHNDQRFGAPLTAITAAVVGVSASLAVFFAGPVLWPGGAFNLWVALVVGLALFAQLQLRWSVLQVIGAAALVGVALTGMARQPG